MEIRAEQALEAIARASMEKCAAKLSRISSGKWRLAGVGVRRRTMAEIVESYPLESEGGAGVFLEVGGAEPFSSMVVFRPEDLEVICRGFLGYSFSKLPVLNQAQELLLSEVGNILLNFFISAMSNALGRSFLPSAPKCVQGGPRFLLEALWATLNAGKPYSVALMTLDLGCDKDVTRIEIVAVIPEGLEQALASAG